MVIACSNTVFRGTVQFLVMKLQILSHIMYLLISLESQLPHKIMNLWFTITNEILSWHFRGGVDFLTMIDEYIVLDKNHHGRSWYTAPFKSGTKNSVMIHDVEVLLP
jgi:hypothetical protein